MMAGRNVRLAKQNAPMNGAFFRPEPKCLEARAGVEPTYTDLQSGA